MFIKFFHAGLRDLAFFFVISDDLLFESELEIIETTPLTDFQVIWTENEDSRVFNFCYILKSRNVMFQKGCH